MKYFPGFLLVLLLVVFTAIPASAQSQCAKIKDGSIKDSVGNALTLGFDQFGYNYQAHMFNGTYDTSDRVADGLYLGNAVDYADDNLIMKWSDEWLSNLDCDHTTKLDRGGAGTDALSKGWLTNHVEGDYLDLSGDSHHYTYFVKIVFDNGGACGTTQPTCIWGTFNIIEEVYNDPFGGYHGVDRSRLSKPAGLGFYTN
jgi:hypothetical protein